MFQSFVTSLMVALQLPGSLGGKKKTNMFSPNQKWGGSTDVQGRLVDSDKVCPFDLQTVSRPLADVEDVLLAFNKSLKCSANFPPGEYLWQCIPPN